jgi:hypothetical protein
MNGPARGRYTDEMEGELVTLADRLIAASGDDD